MRSAILAVSVAALSGCGGMTQFGANDTGQTACPAVRPYEQKFRDALVADLEGLPAGSPVRVAVADYWMLRAAVIDCAGR